MNKLTASVTEKAVYIYAGDPKDKETKTLGVFFNDDESFTIVAKPGMKIHLGDVEYAAPPHHK